jgi:glycosyltransferase involved in cell wall biosynthesis
MDIHLLRTLIINSVTVSVAAAFALNRRRNPELVPRPWPAGVPAPFVEIIIPARNEERNIGALLNSLLAQSYPHDRWRVTVVDDSSTDRTAAIVSEVAGANPQVRLVHSPPLPEGWTGKNHAMYTGFLSASPLADYLLFLDADTRHARDMLSTVLMRAREADAALLSLVTRAEMLTFWQRVITPQIGELYTLLVGTMDSVNDPQGAAAANGQFILVRRDVYASAGSLDSVRGDVAEDRALAAAVKALGHNIRLEYGRDLVSAHDYASLREMWAGFSKTLFWATGRKTARTVVVALALALFALVPPIAFLHALLHRDFRGRRNALRNAPLQLIPMVALRVVVCRSLDIPAVYALTYPLAVLVGDAMLLTSLYRVLSGKGVRWKGRTYL